MSPSKYRNIKVEYDGYKFDSKKEASYYRKLVLRKKAGDIWDFIVKPTVHVAISQVGNGFDIRTFWEIKKEDIFLKNFWTNFEANFVFKYTPDFILVNNQSKVLEVIDVKGHQTPVFKLKKRILEALGLRISIR